MIFVDCEQRLGRGPNALVSWGGPDRSKCMIISDSLLHFLEDHVEKLSSRYYSYLPRNRLEAFPANPLSQYGSVTVSNENGVRIEAVAHYIHFFSVFDANYYSRQKYYFTY